MGIFLFCGLSAQTWAPIGAKWTYDRNYHMWWGYPPFKGYTEFTSVKDTLIQNKNCKKIERQHFAIGSFDITDTVTGFDPPIFLHEDTGRVYAFLEDSFYIIYDFSLMVGDTLAIMNDVGDGAVNWQEPPFKLELDTIDTILIGGHHRIRQGFRSISQPGLYYLGGTYCKEIPNIPQKYTAIEGLGWIGFFVPHNSLMEPWYEGSLLCYSDSLLGHFICTSRPCDSLNYHFMPGIPGKEVLKFKIYRESANYLVIKPDIPDEYLVEIFDLEGRRVFYDKINGNNARIKTSDLLSSVYTVVIRRGADFFAKKFIR